MKSAEQPLKPAALDMNRPSESISSSIKQFARWLAD